MTGMNCRHAKASNPLNELLFGIVGIDSTKFGLDRGSAVERHLVVRLVQITVESDHGVGIDEAGCHNRCIDDPISVGNANLRRCADRFDLAVLNKYDTVGDRFARHCPNGLSADGDLCRCGRG